jgi:hypothetical protein
MIIYTVICRARDAAILVEVSSPELSSGNAPQVTALLLSHLKDHPEQLLEGERKTFVQRNDDAEEDFFSFFMESCSTALGGEEAWVEEHYFHLLRIAGVFYCCIGDDADMKDQKVNFAFLDHICADFTKQYRKSRIEKANAYALDKAFTPKVRTAMHYHNVNHKTIAQEERVKKLLTKVDYMKRVMGVSINLLLEKGENLQKLVQKSDELETDAKIFRKKSGEYRLDRILRSCNPSLNDRLNDLHTTSLFSLPDTL